MYGLSDACCESGYFELKEIAEEQNQLLIKTLSEINNTELMQKIAEAIIDFKKRINSATE
jgi:hypothetical protein